MNFYTLAAIKIRANQQLRLDSGLLNVTRKASRGTGWTAEEDTILRENSSCPLSRDYLPLLPGRTHNSVRARLKFLGLSKPVSARGKQINAWDPTEDQIIVEHYPCSDKELLLTLLPKRTWPSIVTRAGDIGVKRDSQIYLKKWTVEEDAKLEQLVLSNASADAIAAAFPERTAIAVINRTRKIKRGLIPA